MPKDKPKRFDRTTGEGGTAVGNFLRNIFTEENIQKGVGIGMDYLGAKLQSKATRGQGQQAIDYENAKARAASEQARVLEATPQESSSRGGGDRPKWILPVAIGGGVLIIGAILFFALRKKATPSV